MGLTLAATPPARSPAPVLRRVGAPDCAELAGLLSFACEPANSEEAMATQVTPGDAVGYVLTVLNSGDVELTGVTMGPAIIMLTSASGI